MHQQRTMLRPISSARQPRPLAGKAAGRQEAGSRLTPRPCRVLQRDVAAAPAQEQPRGTPQPQSAAAAAAVVADATQRSAQDTPAQQPYRVTQGTIEDIKAYHQSQLCEYDYVVPADWIEGAIPPELVGTFFKNGPGMQTAGRHTFDGDGQIVAFGFDGSGSVRFKNKFVRTRGFLDEQEAGRPVHRTAFTRGAADGSLLFNPFDMALKNVSNTGVLLWAGRLLSLYESNLPYELDAATLNTYGETTLDGQLATPVLAAHYRVMPGRQQLEARHSNGSSNGASSNGNGSSSSSSSEQQRVFSAGAADDGRTLVGFSFNSGLGSPAELLFYEFAEADGRLRHAPVRHALPGVSIALIHDIAVTPDFYVATLAPLEFDGGKFLTQYLTSRCSIAECLQYRPAGGASRVHLIPRPGGAAAGTRAYVIDAPASFIFHHVNAFQLPAHAAATTAASSGSSSSGGKALVVLDTVAWDTISFENSQHNLSTEYYKGGTRPTLQRLVFELDAPLPGGSSNSSAAAAASSTGRCISSERLMQRTLEFPSVSWDAHGQQHAHIYCCADTVDDAFHWGPTQCVLKLSFEDQQQQAQQQQQEPLANITRPRVRTELWDAGSRRFVVEPLFVPKPGSTAEDEGWVLALLHNAASGAGELAILDAQDIAAGPLATIRLRHHLPAGLHGSWSSQVVLQDDPQALRADAWQRPNVVRAV